MANPIVEKIVPFSEVVVKTTKTEQLKANAFEYSAKYLNKQAMIEAFMRHLETVRK